MDKILPRNKLTCITFSMLFTLVFTSTYGQEVFKKNLWEEGQRGYSSYRIPSLIVTAEGTLLAFAEGRKEHGDSGDIDLLMRRSFDNGKTWSEPKVIWDDGKNTCGNPTPVIDEETGRIFLFTTWNLGRDSEHEIIQKTSEDTRRPFMMYSDDDGETWSKPIELSDCCKDPSWGWYATGPGVGIQIQQGTYKGRLVIPANHSYDEADSTLFRRYGKYGYGAHVLFSDDHGKTWKMSKPIRPGANESQVVERSDGTLIMNMRSYNEKHSRAVAISEDGGEIWSAITHDPQLAEPVCQASIFRYGEYDGKILFLFSNPATPTERTHMTVRTSFDEGKRWEHARLIFEGPSAYSSSTKLPDGNIGLFYEAGKDHPYQTMQFLSVPPEVLFSKKSLIKQ